ncbi:protoporphyrinogen oxidase [Anatilimnocola aggregata]|uniref:Protoporphyrinogen oxidase n=1 Tax=Anatilimnocola aggregata TaxID=2528021 RepID=A0A517YG97_9BACT|nr:FAD-dependent oxidoreductase [Anatilimnocola aggregata]QDU29244.1 protoporphyrinogen oxidase [Anatilimnocola aggregata]
MYIPRIGIVGGGPGGLMTAYMLQKLANCPLEVTLFEASPRLGGKILTPQFATFPIRYEAGAAEFYDYSQFDDDPLKELIMELGLPIRPMGGPSVVMNGQILENWDDIREQLGSSAYQSLVQFDRRAKDRMTPQEFYHSDNPEGTTELVEEKRFDDLLTTVAEPTARGYIENMIHSDLATEPAQTSIGYGLQNYLMNDPAYMHLYGIEGGNERLVQEVAARIDAHVRLQSPVQSVEKVGRQLRIASNHQGVPSEDDFDYVVLALPHNRFNTVAYRGETLAAALRSHHAHYDYPTHYLRITILFEQPFWRTSCTDSYWMLDKFGGCCLYDESSRDPNITHGVLGWLLAGQAAEEMSDRDDEELLAQALDSLPFFLEPGRHTMLEGRVHRWTGAVNAIPGGLQARTLDRRHQPEPEDHPNLFVVGDYLFDSTLNGVLESAQYVASWLAARLTIYSESDT